MRNDHCADYRCLFWWAQRFGVGGALGNDLIMRRIMGAPSEVMPRQIPSAAYRIRSRDRPCISAASDRPICHCQLGLCNQRPLSGRPKCLTASLDQSQRNLEELSGCTQQSSSKHKSQQKPKMRLRTRSSPYSALGTIALRRKCGPSSFTRSIPGFRVGALFVGTNVRIAGALSLAACQARASSSWSSVSERRHKIS
jgi:hypothetical protein